MSPTEKGIRLLCRTGLIKIYSPESQGQREKPTIFPLRALRPLWQEKVYKDD